MLLFKEPPACSCSLKVPYFTYFHIFFSSTRAALLDSKNLYNSTIYNQQLFLNPTVQIAETFYLQIYDPHAVCYCIAEGKDGWGCLWWFSLLSFQAGIQIGWTVQLSFTQLGSKCKFCARIEPKLAPVLLHFFFLPSPEQWRILPARMHTHTGGASR